MTMSNQGMQAQGQGQQKELTVADVMDSWYRTKKALGKRKATLKQHLAASQDVDVVEIFINGQVEALRKQASRPPANNPPMPAAKSVREAMRRSAENGGASVPIEVSLTPPNKGPQLVKGDAAKSAETAKDPEVAAEMPPTGEEA